MRARAIDERHRLPHVDLLPEHDARFLLPRHFPGLNLLLGFPTWSHFSWLLCRWASRTISKLPCHPCGIDDRSPFWHCCPLLPRDATPEYRPQRHSRRDCPASRLTPSVGPSARSGRIPRESLDAPEDLPKQPARQVALGQLPLLNRTVLPICSIEVSPHGDLLDEQKGSAAGRVAQGRAGRTYHERARSDGAGGKRAAVSAPEEAVPRAGYPWPAPRPAGAPRQPAPGPAGSRADRRAHDHDLRRLQ